MIGTKQSATPCSDAIKVASCEKQLDAKEVHELELFRLRKVASPTHVWLSIL